VLDRGSWRPPPVFGLLAERGRVAREEMERVFNMGVGMTAVVAAGAADQAVGLLTARGVPAWRAGEVIRAAGTRGAVRLTGSHPG
jgi:phosphoribosylformylglycinamidine cyclo-ligase